MPRAGTAPALEIAARSKTPSRDFFLWPWRRGGGGGHRESAGGRKGTVLSQTVGLSQPGLFLGGRRDGFGRSFPPSPCLARPSCLVGRFTHLCLASRPRRVGGSTGGRRWDTAGRAASLPPLIQGLAAQRFLEGRLCDTGFLPVLQGRASPAGFVTHPECPIKAGGLQECLVGSTEPGACGGQGGPRPAARDSGCPVRHSALLPPHGAG